MANVLRPGRFVNGDTDDIFDGYSDGETQRGWVNPYFTHAQALRVMHAWIDESNCFDARYDVDRDAFVFMTPDTDEDDPMVYYGETCIVEGVAMRLYPLGHDNGVVAWMWSVSVPTEHDK